jgi:hypothetical protein
MVMDVVVMIRESKAVDEFGTALTLSQEPRRGWVAKVAISKGGGQKVSTCRMKYRTVSYRIW